MVLIPGPRRRAWQPTPVSLPGESPAKKRHSLWVPKSRTSPSARTHRGIREKSSQASRTPGFQEQGCGCVPKGSGGRHTLGTEVCKADLAKERQLGRRLEPPGDGRAPGSHPGQSFRAPVAVITPLLDSPARPGVPGGRLAERPGHPATSGPAPRRRCRPRASCSPAQSSQGQVLLRWSQGAWSQEDLRPEPWVSSRFPRATAQSARV